MKIFDLDEKFKRKIKFIDEKFGLPISYYKMPENEMIQVDDSCFIESELNLDEKAFGHSFILDEFLNFIPVDNKSLE